jgi:hypothetical protein
VSTQIEITVPCTVTIKIGTEADVTPEMLANWANGNQHPVLNAIERSVEAGCREARCGWFDDNFAVWTDPDVISVIAQPSSTLGIETFAWAVAS